MKRKLVFAFITVVLITGAAWTLVPMHETSKGVVFVNLSKVYSEFRLTKELDMKMTATEQTRQNILDSLRFEVEALSKQAGSGNKDAQAGFMMKREEYMQKEQQFAQDKEKQSQQYNEQIFKQINQYVADFRQEKGFDMILGADGNGTVMAADEGLDVSKEVIAYLNQKYQGK